MAMFIIYLLLLLPFLAQAQESKPVVFFFNFNYSETELQMAEKIAKERGQSLITVPGKEWVAEAERVSQMTYKIGSALKRAYPGIDDWTVMQHTSSIYEGAWTNSKDPKHLQVLKTLGGSSAIQQVAGIRNNQIQQEEEYKKKNGVPMVVGLLRAKAKEMAKAGQYADSFIVSGHSAGPFFSNEYNQALRIEDFRKLSRENPHVFKKARHVLLMGCYAGDETGLNSWSEVFSNASLLAGFSGRAPHRLMPASTKYMETVMRTADQLDQRGNLEKRGADTVLRALRSVEAINIVARGIDYCGVRLQTNYQFNCEEDWMRWNSWREDIFQRLSKVSAADKQKDFGDKQVLIKSLRSFYAFSKKLCKSDKIDKNFVLLKEKLEPELLAWADYLAKNH